MASVVLMYFRTLWRRCAKFIQYIVLYTNFKKSVFVSLYINSNPEIQNTLSSVPFPIIWHVF